MEGWIKLHRELLEWEWYSDHVVRSLFIHCILKANHKDNNWRGIAVKRGSFVSSYGKSSDELGYSVQQIRTALKKLKSTNYLTYETNRQHTVFQVVRYDEYQSPTNEPTDVQQTNNKRSTTNKNDNNDKNDKNSCFPFDEFWEKYDLKRSKEKCSNAYAKISEEDRLIIKNTLPLYVDSTAKTKTENNGKIFRKNPITYLNNKSWNDEIIGSTEEPRPKKGDTMNIHEIMRKQAEEEKRLGLW